MAGRAVGPIWQEIIPANFHRPGTDQGLDLTLLEKTLRAVLIRSGGR